MLLIYKINNNIIRDRKIIIVKVGVKSKQYVFQFKIKSSIYNILSFKKFTSETTIMSIVCLEWEGVFKNNNYTLTIL